MSETGAVLAQEPEVSTQRSGGKALRFTKGQFEGGWKGLGVLYWREKNGEIEIMAVYPETVSKAVKDEVAARCGIGAHEWQLSEDK